MNPEYGIDGIPTVVMLAPDGTVRHIAAGFDKAKETERIDALLKEFKLRGPEADKSQ